MLRTTLASIVFFAASLAVSAPARAEDGDAMGLGLGAQALLTQSGLPAAVSVTYDLGSVHFDALAGLSTITDTRFLAGARAYYSLHRKTSADLSVGVGGGIELIRPEDPAAQDLTTFHAEAGGKIRAFIAPNVALSATMGFGLLLGDGDGLIFGGQFIGTFGVTYFLD